MAVWSSTIERNTPRFSHRRVSLENKVSGGLAQARRARPVTTTASFFNHLFPRR